MTVDTLHLTRVILNQLAEGAPLGSQRIATAAGLPLKTVERALVFDLPAQLDREGRVVALSLSLESTPHKVVIDGRTLYSWCVGQALMYPTLLGRRVRLESPCRTTGRRVVLDLTPNDVEHLDPAEAVIGSHALADPSPTLQRCDDMRLFSSQEAAQDWSAAHRDAVVLPVATAYARYLPMVRGLDGSSQNWQPTR